MSKTIWIAGALLSAGVLGWALAPLPFQANGGLVSSVAMAADLPRLAPEESVSAEVGSVQDFALQGDTLHLLDRRDGRVVSLRRRAGAGWAEIGSLGRRGGGPGEFLGPTSLVAFRGGLAVADMNGRVQAFDGAGRLTRSVQLDLPCNLTQAQVVPVADSSFVVSGTCRGYPRLSPDTMFGLLLWTPDGKRYDLLAHTAKFSLDGAWGTIFSQMRMLTPGPDDLLFGTGRSGCVSRVRTAGGGKPTTRAECGLARETYAAPPPPSLARRLRRMRDRGPAWQWPGTLAAYVAAVPTAKGTVLLRPWAADSLVAELPAPGGAAATRLFVAPLDSFVGCGAGGCLWYEPGEDGDRLRLLSIADVERYARAPGPPERR